MSNPDVGSPYIIADYVAMDMDASGPFACIDEYQPWCQQAEEYPTSSCAVFPSQPGYICEIEPPPDPLPMPIVFVDEGKKCNASLTLSQPQQAALREYVFKFTTGLGLVLTYENFTCQEGGVSGGGWHGIRAMCANALCVSSVCWGGICLQLCCAVQPCQQ